MFGPFERTVAFRYLSARKGERAISVIAMFSLAGIALGVAALIIVMSVMNGFRHELLGRVLGLNGHLGVRAAAGPLPEFDAIAARIRGLPGVLSATPLVEGQVLLTSDAGGASGGVARGIRPDDLRARAIIAGNLRAGSLATFGGDDAVVIGVRLAERMGLRIGDPLTLVSPQGRVTVVGTIPRVRAYHVVAMFDTGLLEYDSSFIFLPLEAAQVYFQLPNAVSQVEVFVADPDRVRETTNRIRAAFPDRRLGIIDWQDSNSSLFNAVQVERTVMFLILTLIIVVAAFNIISSLIMLVKDKGRDIAILRTVGATRGAVMRIFLLCGASIGVLGTLIGAVLGLLFTLNIQRIQHVLESLSGANLFNAEIYFLTRLPADLDWVEVGQVIAMSLALALLATLFPSWRAARLDPVVALRNE